MPPVPLVPTPPTIYATSHVHSQVVCRALQEGSVGKLAPPVSLLDGEAIVFGILRGCGEIIKQCEWVGRDYLYVDHGYFKRGYYDGYFRACKNSLQADALGDHPSDRWEALNVDLEPWRAGSHILVCPISDYLGKHLNIDPKRWTETVVREIAKHSDRQIIVKYKDGSPLPLKDAHCLVTHSSNAAVDALISGIPVIILGNHPAKALSWGWKDIESPVYPDREQWCFNLACSQFTLEEIRRGIDLP